MSNNPILFLALTSIFTACVLYTIGVWAEKIQKKLKGWNMIVFWAGFVFDTIGTGAMGKMVGSVIQLNFHGITGLTAILLMLFHAIWATIVIYRKDEKMKLKFHKFSFIVWLIWLIPMIGGMVLGSNV